MTGSLKQHFFPVQVIGEPKQLVDVPSTHVCEPATQHSVPVHVMPLPKHDVDVPATHVFPAVDPPDEEPELELDVELDSPQNVFCARAQVASLPAHVPSMHAAAR